MHDIVYVLCIYIWTYIHSCPHYSFFEQEVYNELPVWHPMKDVQKQGACLPERFHLLFVLDQLGKLLMQL